ncbi:KdsC family phosphatase [Uliginosibacterium sp. sgz301328]|uniref:KdsC family phosphatase n=1 Tax=Uliginosibacterium sp. sgz301328 TaxID=3243764 RepID=UPI00359ECB41
MNAHQKAARVRLMAFDVDGVLTDGGLYYSPRGDELKRFSVLDGHGMKMLQKAGVEVAIITARNSPMVALRAENLGIVRVIQGARDKRATLLALREELSLPADETGYMGDDIVDLPILRACGFSATPANGHAFVKAHVDYTAATEGGHGAVREVCEFILAAQGKLDDMLEGYLQ